MKALVLVYNAAIESMVSSCMKECGIESYTKFPRIHGAGRSAGPRLDTHVWPGLNNALLVVSEDEKLGAMTEKIRDLKARHSREGIKAFILPVEEII